MSVKVVLVGTAAHVCIRKVDLDCRVLFSGLGETFLLTLFCSDCFYKFMHSGSKGASIITSSQGLDVRMYDLLTMVYSLLDWQSCCR